MFHFVKFRWLLLNLKPFGTFICIVFVSLVWDACARAWLGYRLFFQTIMVYYRSMCSTLLLGTFNVQFSEQFCWHCNFLCNFFYLCNENSVGLGVCLNCSSVVVAISKDIGCPYHKSEHSTGSSPHSRSLQMSHECFETHLKIKNKT